MLHEVRCIAHVHSRFSDGTATVPELAEAARQAGAQVVLLTDHDTLAARHTGYERWYDDVLVLVGCELSSNIGHLLAFGLENELFSRKLPPHEVVSAVEAQGGFAFGAHPFEVGTGFSRRISRPRPWPLLESDSVGVELWSLLSDAVHRFTNLGDIVRFMRNHQARWQTIPKDHVAAWDRLCQRRRVPAIGGIDAHQFGIRLGRLGSRFGKPVLTPFANRRWFSYLQTVALTRQPLSGEVGKDSAAVYDALREGRCYLARPNLASPAGFQFWAQAKNGRRIEIGEERRSGTWQLEVRTPYPAQINLVKDGHVIAARFANTLSHAANSAGVYRVEVSLLSNQTPYTWIATNPIYLRDSRHSDTLRA